MICFMKGERTAKKDFYKIGRFDFLKKAFKYLL